MSMLFLLLRAHEEFMISYTANVGLERWDLKSLLREHVSAALPVQI